MSKLGKEIINGLHEAIAYMDESADKSQYQLHEFPPLKCPDNVDIKAIRHSLGLSQARFASAFGLSLYTLRNWEQGHRIPDPAARAYLKVIEKAPDIVQKALQPDEFTPRTRVEGNINR